MNLKANELRIQNLVLCSPIETPQFIATIEEIGEKKARIKECKQDPIIGYLEYDFISPIQLTDEWFLRFGLHKDNYGIFEWVKDGGEYCSGCVVEFWVKRCFIDDEWVFDVSVGSDFANTVNFCYVKYVHQFQNVFHSKTGQELETTP